MNVYAADMSEEGFNPAKLYDYDCVLMDINFLDKNGREVRKHLRLRRADVPPPEHVGIDGEESNFKRFHAPENVYPIRPVACKQFAARTNPIARRAAKHVQSMITTGKVVVDLDARRIEVEGKKVHLTRKEYQILELMSMHKGTTLSRYVFLNYLYDHSCEPKPKILDVFIWKLRKKLSEATMGENYIQTVWGRGYVLLDPIEHSKKR